MFLDVQAGFDSVSRPRAPPVAQYPATVAYWESSCSLPRFAARAVPDRSACLRFGCPAARYTSHRYIRQNVRYAGDIAEGGGGQVNGHGMNFECYSACSVPPVQPVGVTQIPPSRRTFRTSANQPKTASQLQVSCHAVPTARANVVSNVVRKVACKVLCTTLISAQTVTVCKACTQTPKAASCKIRTQTSESVLRTAVPTVVHSPHTRVQPTIAVTPSRKAVAAGVDSAFSSALVATLTFSFDSVFSWAHSMASRIPQSQRDRRTLSPGGFHAVDSDVVQAFIQPLTQSLLTVCASVHSIAVEVAVSTPSDTFLNSANTPFTCSAVAVAISPTVHLASISAVIKPMVTAVSNAHGPTCSYAWFRADSHAVELVISLVHVSAGTSAFDATEFMTMLRAQCLAVAATTRTGQATASETTKSIPTLSAR